jgi:ATP-dependent exoDNAse (exonuclease V) alpha subunit
VAIYHLSVDIVRRSAGRTVTAAAAYRAAELIADQRTGLIFDYHRRAGVTHTGILAPENAPAWMCARASLWNGVEAAEKRKDAQLARDITLALPHELAPARRLELVRSFVAAAFVGEGMVADIAIHVPCRPGADVRNHHAHILLTMRAIEGDGFGAKVRAWNDTAKLETWRASWADHVNRTLEEAGENARVDHRSLAAQGIDREAQIHLGPAVVELAARGIETDRGDVAKEIEAINAALAGIEEPARRSPPATVAPALTLAPGRDLVRRRASRPGGGILAAFRNTAREIWGRMKNAVRSADLALGTQRQLIHRGTDGPL